MALTRIKSQSILDREVREQDLAEGAVSFNKLLLTDIGDPGDVLTVDAFGNLLFAPANGTPRTLNSLDDVNVGGATNNQVLQFNAVASTWQPVTIPGLSASSNTFVVNNISERDALFPSDGDTCYVRSGASGEWEFYVYDSAWVGIATADSARSDANTMEAIVFFNSSTPVLVGNVSDGSRITNVTIEILPGDEFDGDIIDIPPTAPAFFSVGDVDDNARLIDDSVIEWDVDGSYVCNLDYIYDGTEQAGTDDTDIFAYFNFSNSTTGQARIVITHV